jgi:hypothetical protein
MNFVEFILCIISISVYTLWISRAYTYRHEIKDLIKNLPSLVKSWADYIRITAILLYFGICFPLFYLMMFLSCTGLVFPH